MDPDSSLRSTPRVSRVSIVAAVVSVLGALASAGPFAWRMLNRSDLVSRRTTLPNSAARFRVMCLGDSITDYGYPNDLSILLGSDFRISNEGVSGETTGQMLGRWRLGLRPTRADFLVVLGGVNDLRLEAGLASPVTANLQTLYTEAQQAGSHVIAVTVLPFEGASGWTPEAERERQLVNAFIMDRCRESTGMTCVDAATAMRGPGNRLASPLDVGDHLHLSREGRQRLASLVAAALKSAAEPSQ